MKTKAKKFSHKLLALLMALVMGITCFSGVMTSFAATSNEVKYLDQDLEYNQLAWRMVSDEQTATAILDYLDDDLLPNTVAPMVENLFKSINVNITGVATISYDSGSHILKLNFVLGAYKYNLYVNLNSIDEIIKTIDSVDGLLNNSDFTSMLPTLKYAHLTALKGMSRDKNTSCEILSGVLGLLRQISFNAGADHTSSNVQNDILGEVLRGNAVLLTDTMKNLVGKVLASFVGISIDLDLYNLISDLLGGESIGINLENGYQSNLVYNLVKAVLLDKSGFFSKEDVKAYRDGTKEFKYDTVLLDALSTQLLQKINVLVTYDSAYGTGDFDEDNNEIYTTDNSINRKKAINALMYNADGSETGVTYEAACNQLGYDPNLRYSTEIKYDAEGNVAVDYTGNILLFVYGDEKLSLQADDTLMSFAYRALKLAWKTVLSGTVDLIHVNNDVDRGHGKNFDNAFYYWSQTHFTWNYDNVAANYSEANLNAWAADVWQDEEYNATSAADFLENVKNTFEYDRTSLETSDGSWEDIDATTLFGKLRYSPLADYGFNMQTGPINLYFLQTGTTYLDEFFNSKYSTYGSITAGFNDCLVAAVKDIFATSSNVIGSLPKLTETSSTNPTVIAKTLVDNALQVIEYTADATDANILKAFRAEHPGEALSEANLETAMMPMLMACVGQVDLGDAPLGELIHPEDWNACKDAEGLAYLALREYLSYVQPGRDYSVLVNADGNGGYTGGKIESTLEGTIMPMARDALGYIMEPLVPLYDANNQRWSATSSAIDDKETTIFHLLNSVICYYANDYQLKSGRTNGVAALLGLCDNDGNSLIKPTNDIWTNIDLVANHLLPVFGELQYATKGAKLDSKDFVWNDIVLSFLEIGNINSNGLGGVGNFLERFITLFTAPAVSETKVINTVYNFVADLFNALFGVRYDSQKFGEFIPASTSATPFDDLMQKDVLAGTDTQYNPGVIQKIFIRLCEATGYGGYGSNDVHAFPDSAWRGIAFAMNALVSFLPNVFPTLADSAVKNGTASTSPSYVTGIEQGSTVSGTVTFKNNITGMNTAYVDESGNVQQNQRYTVKLTKAYVYEVSNPNNKTALPDLSNKLLQPGETVTASYTQQFYPSDGSTATYISEIHYDYVYLNGDPITDIYGMTDVSAYTDLIANAFQYVGVMPSWADDIYPNGQYMNVTRTASGTTTTPIGQNSVNGTATLNSNLTLSYPSDFLITTADPMAVSKYTFSVYNKNSSDKGMDGIYPYDNKTVVNAYNGNSVAVNASNAKLAHDDEGNAVIYGSYDYRIGNGEWQRNPQTVVLVDGTEDKYKATIQENIGYSLSDISSIKAGLSEADQNQFEVRTHVIFTPEELNAKGMLQAVEMTNGVCTGLYIKTSTTGSFKYNTPGLLWDGTETCYPYQYDTVLSRLCMESPIDGTYMASGKITAKSKSQTATLPFMVVSDRDALTPGVFPISMAAYSGGKTVTMDFNVVIVDDAMKNEMQKAYNDYTAALAKYTPRDFDDYNAATGTSASYQKAVDGAKQALTTLSTPLTLQNRDEINSVYEAGVTAVTAAKAEMLAALDKDNAVKIVKEISAIREPLQENNFNIITYNTMRDAAKDAESKYSLNFSYVDAQGNTIKKTGISYNDYKWYRDEAKAGKITFVGATAENVAPYSVESALSSAEITEYVRLFNFYLNLMVERGYIGNQIEAEIECAGGAKAETFEVTPAVVDADGNITTNAVVKNTSIAAPQFGKYVDGVLVNEGDITYPTALWNNYINRLAKAVEIAQLGNGSYAHKTQALYVVGADDYDACVTKCYTADSLLQVAEIALENTYVVDMQATEGGSVQMTYGEDAAAETFTNAAKVAIPWKDSVTITPVANEGSVLETLTINGEAVELDENGQYTGKITADTVVAATFTGGASSDITVSGTVMIATDLAGASYTKGIVGINILANGEVVGTTNSDGTFTVTVPVGTTELVFAGSTTVDRTVTLSGDADVTGAIVPVVICDYNHDGDINAADKSTFLSSFSGSYNVYCDLNGDTDVNAADKSYFLGFFGKTVAYNDLAIG